jgi:hypothetical protein
MKKIAQIIIVAMCAFFATEVNADAQLLKNLLNKATETVSDATSSGQAAGAALKALYTQYKADGKLDMTNLNNIINLTTLSNNIKELKGMSNKSTFYKDFATGLMKGSDSLVDKSNSTSVMNGLTNLVNNVDLSSLTESTTQQTTTTSTATSASEIVSSVSNILNLLK